MNESFRRKSEPLHQVVEQVLLLECVVFLPCPRDLRGRGAEAARADPVPAHGAAQRRSARRHPRDHRAVRPAAHPRPRQLGDEGRRRRGVRARGELQEIKHAAQRTSRFALPSAEGSGARCEHAFSRSERSERRENARHEHVEERALASDEKCECVSAECGCQRVSGGRLPPQVQSRERSPVVRDARSPESRPENRPPRGAYAPPPYGVGVRAERGKNPVKKRACIYKNTFIET